MNSHVARGILAAATLATSTAHAQQLSGGLNVQLFRPVGDGQGFFITSDAEILEHLELNGSLFMNYARNPLEVARRGSGKRLAGVIDSVITLDLQIGLGIFDIADVFLGVPATLSQDRSGPLFDDDSSVSGFNDINLGGKVQVFARSETIVGFAVLALVAMPSGDSPEFLGAESATFETTLIGDIEPVDNLVVAVNFGYRFRAGQTPSVGKLEFDDQLIYSLGVGYRFETIEMFRKWEAMAETFGSTVAKNAFQNIREGPIEFLFGLRRYTDDGFVFNFGFGTGLNKGIGSPDYRVLLGLTFYPFEKATPGPSLECPPCIAERICEYEGEEDLDGFQDDDGCPDPDNDHDGIFDVDDACPNEAEDTDGYQDEDGCPEPDNDGDGLPDLQDRCPLDPEDIDEFEDSDGCPDPDNDGDRILDVDDKCLNEPEDVDSFEDDDGCPEQGKGRVAIVGRKIEILDKIYFKTGSVELDLRKSPILNQVGEILVKNLWVLSVEVQGHTDSRGSKANNQSLSQRRAESVTIYLMSRGVAAERLIAKGLGESQPIQSNQTSRGRATNRRVEFVILETEGGEASDPGVDIEHGDTGRIRNDEEP